MRGAARLTVCVLLTVATVAGVATAATHRASWYDFGLLGIYPVVIGLGVLAKSTNLKDRGGTHPGRVATITVLVLLVGYPLFWLYCLVYALTGSWIWATPVTVVAGYLTYDYAVYRVRRKTAATGADPLVATE